MNEMPILQLDFFFPVSHTPCWDGHVMGEQRGNFIALFSNAGDYMVSFEVCMWVITWLGLRMLEEMYSQPGSKSTFPIFSFTVLSHGGAKAPEPCSFPGLLLDYPV